MDCEKCDGKCIFMFRPRCEHMIANNSIDMCENLCLLKIKPKYMKIFHRHCNTCRGCLTGVLFPQRINCQKCAAEHTARKKAKGRRFVFVKNFGMVDLSTTRTDLYDPALCLCCQTIIKRKFKICRRFLYI